MEIKIKQLYKNICSSLFFITSIFSVTGQTVPVYLDDNKNIEERIEDALLRMNIAEKIAIIHAQSKFCSPGVPSLGIPEFWMTDGPHGIRPEVLWDEWNQAGWTNDSCVAFPALTSLAATWDVDLSLKYGQCIGAEARYRNKTVLLGPGVNIYRTPLNGRNFEYMGEDPYLASQMVVPYIKGVQQNGVAACIKHFALNNHEANRHTTNIIVDDRALHEIYLPAFKTAVFEGNVWSIMGSYNLYKDQHGCHNQYLLNDILKRDWSFDGVVISDWGGTHDTEQAICNGLDMEFGSWTNGLSDGSSNAYDNYYLADPYFKLINDGKYGTKELDDKVRRVLRLAFRTNMDRKRPFGAIRAYEHFNTAKEIGEAGIVLLQNKDNVLPIKLNKAKKIAVIGENAIKMMTVGGGSSSLKVKYEISPLQGIINRFKNNAEVFYARGYVGDTSGEYNGVISGQDLKDERSEEELIEEAVKLASEVDYVIMIGGLNKSNNQDCEDSDRESLNLPYNQDKLILKLAKSNKNFIYINISGNAVAMPWKNDVGAILQTWYLGSEAGSSIASILSGDVNPSGKLPFSFAEKLDDYGAHHLSAYPGTKRDGSDYYDLEYSEGIFVGYRWFEKMDIKPLFPFGHGLSYTDFEYGKVTTDKTVIKDSETITFNINITNKGNRAGAEVVQLYISDKKSSLPRPKKELKGFKKIYLEKGETKTVSITIDKNQLSFYNDKISEWQCESGKFEALIGSSSSDIRAKIEFVLK